MTFKDSELASLITGRPISAVKKSVKWTHTEYFFRHHGVKDWPYFSFALECCDWNCSDLSIQRIYLFPSIQFRSITMSKCTHKYRIAQQKLSNNHISIIAFPNKHFIFKKSRIVFPNVKPYPDNPIDAERPGEFLVAFGVIVEWQEAVKLTGTPFLSVPGWKSISGCPRIKSA